MKNKTSLICLSLAIYFLVGLMCMASFISCTNTRIVTSSKIADGDGKATMSWENVASAVSYNIYYSDSPGITKQNGEKIADVGNPFTFEGLQRGKTYYAIVTAVSTCEESKESEELSFTAK